MGTNGIAVCVGADTLESLCTTGFQSDSATFDLRAQDPFAMAQSEMEDAVEDLPSARDQSDRAAFVELPKQIIFYKR